MDHEQTDLGLAGTKKHVQRKAIQVEFFLIGWNRRGQTFQQKGCNHKFEVFKGRTVCGQGFFKIRLSRNKNEKYS